MAPPAIRAVLSALLAFVLAVPAAAVLPARSPAHDAVLPAPDGGAGPRWEDNTSQLDMLSQVLRVQLCPHNYTLLAEGHVRFRSNYNITQTQLYLHNTLDVLHLEEGGRALPFTRSGDFLNVDLSPGVKKGQVLELNLSYSGVVYVLENGLRQDCIDWQDGAYVKGSTFWYLRHHASDWADFNLTFCCPANWTAVADGELTAEEHSAEWANYTFVTDKPCMRPAFAAGNYSVVSKPSGGVNISCYTYPQDGGTAQSYLDEAASILVSFGRYVGNYQRKSFRIVETAHQTMTGYACSGFVMLYPTAFRGSGCNYNLLAHEMAHEWFPFATGYTGWAYPWLWEGFSEYLSCLYEKEKYGKWDRLSSDRDAFLQYHDDPGEKPIRATTWEDPLSYQILYAKGAWVLHMLRGLQGDAAFYATLKEYVGDNLFAMGSVDAFIALAGRHSPIALGGFFEQWLNTTKELDVSLPSARLYENGTAYVLELEPLNLQCATEPTDLCIDYIDGTNQTVKMGWDGKARMVRLEVPKEVYKVRLDPEGWLLDLDRGNEVAMPVKSGKIYDLQVASMTISGELFEGRPTVFMALVRNNSSYEAANLVLDFLVDGLPLKNHTFTLAAGNEYVLAANWTAVLGCHTLAARVDPNDRFHEWNESNNNASLAVEVAPPPPVVDLWAGNVSVEPSDLSDGDCATFRATVSNIGEAAVGQFSAQFLVDGRPVESLAVPELRPGSSRNISARWMARKGAHNVSVVVDPLELVNESDRRNNRAELGIFVRWPLDLWLNASTEAPAAWEQVTFVYHCGFDVDLILDFGDGVTAHPPNETGRMHYAFHTYERPGTYIVKLRGMSGGMEEETSILLNVTDRPLELGLHANTTSVPTLVPVLFTARMMNQSDNQYLVRWDFGDGTRKSGGLSEEHLYRRAGSYTVNCTVTAFELEGENASALLTIEVQNRPPQVKWDGPQKLRTGARAAFVANGSDMDGNITAYRWSFGDGAEATGASVNHSFSRAGRYHVAVEAVDDMGSNASFEALVVAEEPPASAPSFPSWMIWSLSIAALASAGAFLLRWWKRRRDRDYMEFFSGRG